MTTKPPVIRTEDQITIILSGRPRIADRSHGNFELIVAALNEGRYNDLENLFDIKSAIEAWSEGKYTVTEDSVTYDDERLPNSLERRILAFFAAGEDFAPLLAFHKRLQANPSRSSVQELYTFLEHKSIPIDENGYFYAYKAITQEWTDIYTGKVDNSIGATPSMTRNHVDDNRNNHCSHGYHVGSLHYVKWYGNSDSRYVICRVDPAEVVSVPLDHDCQKVRVTGYEVVSEFTGALPETRWSPEDESKADDETEITFDDVDDDYDEWREDLEAEKEELECEMASLQDRLQDIDDQL